MKVHLTALFALLLATQTHAADLETQLTGYWVPDVEKTYELAKKENRTITRISRGWMPKLGWEFGSGTMLMHFQGNQAVNPPEHFSIKRSDKAKRTLVLEFEEGKPEYTAIVTGHDQLTLSWEKDKFVLNRISKEAFAKRYTPPPPVADDVTAQDISTRPPAGAEQSDRSPEERERGMKLLGGDLSVATNEVERFYALGHAARNALRDGKVKEAEALASELARLAPKYKNDWNYGNAIEDANQVLGRIALSKGDIAEAKKRLLASADSQGSPQLNSFGPDFRLARELAEKGERETVIAFLDAVARFWANPDERTETNSKRIANEHLKQLQSWKKRLRAGEVPDHHKWR